MSQKVVRMRARIGGKIVFALETGLSLEGEPSYALPEELTPAFAQAWMELPVGEELFIGEIMSQVSPLEKRRFSAFCRATGGTIWNQFCQLAVRWATLLNGDNTWHLETMDLAYERKLGFPWVSNVYVTSCNFRLLATPKGVLSFEEFYYKYGERLQDYILRHRAEVVEAVDDVLLHAFSPLKRVKASIINAQGEAAYHTLVGPETLALEFWRVPAGCTLLTPE